MKTDIHQQVTDAIIDVLESGRAHYTKPWITLGGPARRHNGERYRGINALLLGLIGMSRGYSTDTWMTFNQAKALGGKVRKGEKSAPCTFYKPLTVEDRETGEETEIPMVRLYRVFNVAQIDDLPDRYAAPVPDDLPPKERNERAEAAMRSSGADIRESDDNRAYYNRLADTINLPRFALFCSTDDYLATMAHELTHWTGGEDRLAREYGKKFGDPAYAFEELVAEIGAAFICARLGIAGNHINSHAGYIENWLKALRNDNRMIFRAATLAEKAADLALANAGEEDRAAQPETVEPEPADPGAALAREMLAAVPSGAFRMPDRLSGYRRLATRRAARTVNAPVDELPLFGS